MQRVLKGVLLLSLLGVLGAPATARADGFVSPFIGANFLNNSGNGRSNFGADLDWSGLGILGLEADLGYAPSFFGNQGTFGSNSVADFMGNVIVGLPAGRAWGPGVRPYFAIGLGDIRSQLNGGPHGTTALTTNSFALDSGVGLMGFFSHHVGIRGDVRYFRNLVNGTTNPNEFNVDFGSFHFWRASFGVIIR